MESEDNSRQSKIFDQLDRDIAEFKKTGKLQLNGYIECSWKPGCIYIISQPETVETLGYKIGYHGGTISELMNRYRTLQPKMQIHLMLPATKEEDSLLKSRLKEYAVPHLSGRPSEFYRIELRQALIMIPQILGAEGSFLEKKEKGTLISSNTELLKYVMNKLSFVIEEFYIIDVEIVSGKIKYKNLEWKEFENRADLYKFLVSANDNMADKLFKFIIEHKNIFGSGIIINKESAQKQEEISETEKDKTLHTLKKFIETKCNADDMRDLLTLANVNIRENTNIRYKTPVVPFNKIINDYLEEKGHSSLSGKEIKKCLSILGYPEMTLNNIECYIGISTHTVQTEPEETWDEDEILDTFISLHYLTVEVYRERLKISENQIIGDEWIFNNMRVPRVNFDRAYKEFRKKAHEIKIRHAQNGRFPDLISISSAKICELMKEQGYGVKHLGTTCYTGLRAFKVTS